MSQYTKSLLHFNGANNSTTFTDETGKVWTRNGDAKISTAQSKFGGASGYFDGTGDYISMPDHADFDFGTGGFTVDFWVRGDKNPWATFDGLIALGTYGVAQVGALEYQPWCINWETSGNTSSTGIGDNWMPAYGVWQHVAFVREPGGTAFKLYIDGVFKGSVNVAADSTFNLDSSIWIGRVQDWYGKFYIDEFRISNIARWTANFTPPTSEYSIGLALNVVIESPENIREVINRIAYEASSMEYWDAGQHNLVYLPTHTTVSKTIDANRIDLGTISVGYTDRVDLLNSMTLWYRHYWSGYSGDAAFRKSVSDSDATSIAKFGTLSSDPLQFKYLGNTNDTLALANAQRAIRWILTQQKTPRVTVEFTGGYYLTDLTRSNLIQFSFTARDELDKAFSGLVSTSDKFIIMDIVRGTGQIKIKAVQLITL